VNQVRASDLRAGSQDQVTLAELDRLQGHIDQLRTQLTSERNARAGELDAAAVERLVRAILRARRRREAMFGADLFGEPSWDLLLELYAAELAQHKISVSSACLASAVAPTTALRWISKLERDGWIRREADPRDRRRYWLFLTPQGVSAMRSFLADIEVRPFD
jgi:DNA-binding MarR family transcriptional regulator